MPFVGGDDSPPPARKRRWQDHDDDGNDTRGLFTLYRDENCSFGGISARKMAAPISKRTRFDIDDDDTTTHLHNNSNNNADWTPSHRRRPSQQSQKQKTQQQTTQQQHHRSAAPCHICHRRPTKKSDLDSFAQCEGCRAQTCFVCIRQCHGRRGDTASVLSEQEALSRSFHMEDAAADDACDLDGRTPPAQPPQEQTREQYREGAAQKSWAAGGHCSVVCSRCCVEKGPEGEAVCLGCLFGAESPEDMTF
ncbi:hypothetical protein LEL_02062 [Akanthomyces lecanii RCEF 1005]|uniref:Uncharacterized protein n=1 Tax=Akanthomyces lecanii RCEF 1005 TaxID=1081108 RepID=A0A168L013_CORDF|nr:hypothetical protein LEL_02062 [Akanthomyces lecanii RCEF 1005]